MTTKHAAVPLPTLFGIGLKDAATTDGTDAPSFESTIFRSTKPVSLRRLHALLAAFPRGVVRVKGILNLVEKPGHRGLLQVSGGQTTVTVGPPWEDDEAETRLVFIGLSASIDAQWIAEGLETVP